MCSCLKEARITNITFYLWSTMAPVFVEHILSSRGKANSRKGKGHRGKGIKARSGGYGGNLSRSVIYTYIKAKEGPVNVVPWDLRGLGILRTRHMKGGYFPKLLIYFSRIVF